MTPLVPRDMLEPEFPDVLASSGPFEAACLAHGWDVKQAREVVRWTTRINAELVRGTGLDQIISAPERLNAVTEQLDSVKRPLRLVTNGEAV